MTTTQRLSDRSDIDLLKEIRRGNASSQVQQEFFSRFHDMIHGCAQKVLKSSNAPLRRPGSFQEDELVAEGMMGVYKAMSKFNVDHDSGASFSTYAWSWIKKHVLAYIESEFDAPMPIGDVRFEDQTAPSRIESNLESQELLDFLDLPQKEVVYRRIWRSESFREIGDEMGFSKATAGRYYRKGISHLRRVMKRAKRYK